MVKREQQTSQSPVKTEDIVQTPSLLRSGIERLNKRITELERFEPNVVVDQFHHPELDAIKASIDDALSRTFGHRTTEYARYKAAIGLNTGSIFIDERSSLGTIREAVRQSKERSLALLRQAVSSLEEQLEESGGIEAELVEVRKRAPTRRAFVVHGHDEGAREMVARFLEKLGLEAIVLHEQANQGRTVIEKIEAHGDVDFAVVLLTPDDTGSVKGGTLEPRARQNVLLELGYFMGRLGRSKVCALKRGDVNIPSDFAGVVWETMDEGSGWKQSLARELDAAGHDVDWNKVMKP